MAARAATIAFCLAALTSAGRALAEDDPSCAQYQEPMAYNACLARHGPKAGDVGAHSAPAPRGDARRLPDSAAGRTPNALMGACTWSSTSAEQRFKPVSAAPGRCGKRRRRALCPARWESSAGPAFAVRPWARRRGI